MGIENKYILNYANKKTSQKPKEIYSSGKSPNSSGSFGFKKTERTNQSTLRKINEE